MQSDCLKPRDGNKTVGLVESERRELLGESRKPDIAPITFFLAAPSLPPSLSRKVYRGLGKMQLPPQFWVPHGNPAWRGGVERALMSTTADKGVALFYADGRGTVVEISVGRIQIGGDVSFLSMVRPSLSALSPRSASSLL